MAWIRIVDLDAAEGLLKKVYDAALSRAGRVFNVVRIQSLNPAVAQSSMMHYANIMKQPSPLSRAQREMIATVVSRANHCHY